MAFFKSIFFTRLFLVLACIYLLILQVLAIWPMTVDDAFIPLRYAQHWVEEGAILWNSHEPPVEGYSNFSFVVLGALAVHGGVNPILVLKGLGVLGFWLSNFGLYCLSRFWFPPMLACLPFLCLSLYDGQLIWAVGGLETTIFQALIIFALFWLWKGLGYRWQSLTRQEISEPSLAVAIFLMVLASLTRPEAPFILVFFLLISYFDLPQLSPRQRGRCILRAILLFLILYAPYFCWRLYYYQRLFPNPIYCKGLSYDLFTLDRHYLILAWPFMVLAVYGLFKSRDKRLYALFMPSVLYLLLLLDANPVMSYSNRLFLPAFALLLVMAWRGSQLLIQRCIEKNQQPDLRIPLYALLFLIMVFLIPKRSLIHYQMYPQGNLAMNQERQALVLWLNQRIKPQSHIVLGDCGLIPYLSPFAFIDSFCLNNREMAQYPKKSMDQQFCQKILKDKPGVMILSSLAEKKRVVRLSVEKCLHKHILNHDYHFMRIFKGSSDEGYRYEIYALNSALKKDVNTRLH